MLIAVFFSFDDGWAKMGLCINAHEHTGLIGVSAVRMSTTCLRFCVSSSLGLRYATSPSPEDKRYRDSLSPPCATLVVDNVSPEVSAEDITSIFAKVRRSVCLHCLSGLPSL